MKPNKIVFCIIAFCFWIQLEQLWAINYNWDKGQEVNTSYCFQVVGVDDVFLKFESLKRVGFYKSVPVKMIKHTGESEWEMVCPFEMMADDRIVPTLSLYIKDVRRTLRTETCQKKITYREQLAILNTDAIRRKQQKTIFTC